MPLRGYATVLAALLGAIACAVPSLVVRSEVPALAGRFASRGVDAMPQPWPERWLVVALAPEMPGPFDADVPDLSGRAVRALRESGFTVVEHATLAPEPGPWGLARHAAESGVDGVIFVRLTLRAQVRRTQPLRYLASTATFGMFPWTVASDVGDYALELVAVGASTGAVAAESLATRSVTQHHTLWQTAEGDLLGWDIGEALGGARRRKRVLETEVADELLAETVAALAQAPGRGPPG